MFFIRLDDLSTLGIIVTINWNLLVGALFGKAMLSAVWHSSQHSLLLYAQPISSIYSTHLASIGILGRENRINKAWKRECVENNFVKYRGQWESVPFSAPYIAKIKVLVFADSSIVLARGRERVQTCHITLMCYLLLLHPCTRS